MQFGIGVTKDRRSLATRFEFLLPASGLIPAARRETIASPNASQCADWTIAEGDGAPEPRREASEFRPWPGYPLRSQDLFVERPARTKVSGVPSRRANSASSVHSLSSLLPAFPVSWQFRTNTVSSSNIPSPQEKTLARCHIADVQLRAPFGRPKPSAAFRKLPFFQGCS